MLFNSFTYAVFLVAVLCVYLRLPLRGRQIFLLVMSYLFYCWETPIYGTLLAISTLLDYYCGLGLARTQNPGLRRLILGCSVAGNLGMLGFFKYGDFFIANTVGLGRLLGFEIDWTPMRIILPVGISFYTFQTMSYTIQMYRRQTEPCRDLINFGLFVTFFPQLVAGPIERANHLLPQLLVYQRVTWEDIGAGLTRIIFGFFRKLVLADRFAILANAVFAAPEGYSTFAVWTSLMAFSLQIYFDFAGYSDIAIGSARLFGVRIVENFRRPLYASSIADFWNRWHISLTSWLRDYLFYPLGGFRKGGGRALLNGMIVLLLCGLWHGASWHFVFWGGFHAVLLALYYLWRGFRKRMGWKNPSRRLGVSVLFAVAFTYLCTMFSAVFFRAPNVPVLGRMLKIMFGFRAEAGPPTPWVVWGYWAIFVAFALVEFAQEYLDLNDRIRRWPWVARTIALSMLVAAIVLLAVNNSAPYIYFQF
ncbi:MAG TPA: MBOAT family O-acyltransferase [Kiritimatiellia bacterium]|nr:MBOAT family O-acyltransferase [Kiritimatiellia bacterium]HRZ12281.1 MBOAT family O-acyltransferase [Kiritimatiellia bacterium]HSA17961.1 MBOAT family O-acyltransferase [Kiritimatiellia bacterium]